VKRLFFAVVICTVRFVICLNLALGFRFGAFFAVTTREKSVDRGGAASRGVKGGLDVIRYDGMSVLVGDFDGYFEEYGCTLPRVIVGNLHIPCQCTMNNMPAGGAVTRECTDNTDFTEVLFP